MISKILKVSRFYSSEFLAYPSETLALIARRVLEVGMLLLLWYLVSQENNINGLEIVPYILLASGVLFFTVGHNYTLGGEIANDVKFGKITNLLIRPINELVYSYGAHLGRSIFEIVFSVLYILVGILLVSDLDLYRLGLFLLSLIPAFIIGFSLNIMVAAASFWIVEIGYLRLISYFFLRIISGMFIPLTFFSGWMGNIIQYLPFAQIAFVPSIVLSGDDVTNSARFVWVGFIWAAVMLYISIKLWKTGLRRYSAVGI